MCWKNAIPMKHFIVVHCKLKQVWKDNKWGSQVESENGECYYFVANSTVWQNISCAASDMTQRTNHILENIHFWKGGYNAV
jgi:hypothetical protein